MSDRPWQQFGRKLFSTASFYDTIKRGSRGKVSMQYVIKLQDGKNEPIKDLNNATRVILVDQKTAGAEDITFGHCSFAAKTSNHNKHIHEDAEEVIYILSGRGISGLGKKEVEMVKGDTMFVPRGAVHWFYNPFDEPVEMIFAYSRPSLKTAGYDLVEKKVSKRKDETCLRKRRPRL